MAALQYPPLANHPSIVNLEGLCWETAANGSDISPVLVFRKAQCSLDQYLLLPEGAAFTIEDRMVICGEIARMVHGDIKPQNILVYRSPTDPDVIGIKVTDFGFSCLGSAEGDLVKLGQSKPWAAPEYHDNLFTLGDAKKTDIYSFGLLCLWTIFHDGHLQDESSSNFSIQDGFRGSGRQEQSRLEALKENGQLLDSVLNVISTNSTLSRDTHAKLQEVFKRSLQRHPPGRAATMSIFVELLSAFDDYGEMDEVAPDDILPEWHHALKIEDIFYDLEACDCRIYRYITKKLQEASRLDSEGHCAECSRNAAFQAAICSSFGFGTELSSTDVADYLAKSDRGFIDVQDTVEKIKGMLADVGVMATLIRLASNTMRSKNILGKALWAAEDRSSAVRQMEDVVATRQRVLGTDDYDTVNSAEALACMYLGLGDLDKAEGILNKFLTPVINRSKNLPTSFLYVGRSYALALVAAGQYESARVLQELKLDICKEVLGLSHDLTVSMMNDISVTYSKLGEEEKVESLRRLVLNFVHKQKGPDHEEK